MCYLMSNVYGKYFVPGQTAEGKLIPKQPESLAHGPNYSVRLHAYMCGARNNGRTYFASVTASTRGMNLRNGMSKRKFGVCGDANAEGRETSFATRTSLCRAFYLAVTLEMSFGQHPEVLVTNFISAPILRELEDVLSRSKFGLRSEEVHEIMALVRDNV